MDAKEFLREWGRMCKQHDICKECDADSLCHKYTPTTPNPELVDAVEKWAKTHRALSNDEMMRKTFGEINIVMAGSVTIKTPDGKVKDFRSWLYDEYVSPPIIEKRCLDCGYKTISSTAYPCSKCKDYEYWEAKDDHKGHV